MSDGLGSCARLIAALALACNEESPFTLIIHFSTIEASVCTKDYYGVPLTSQWKDSCESGGYLVSWKTDDIWTRLSSAEMHGIFSKSDQTPFALGLRNIFKQLQDNKMRGPSRVGNLLLSQNRVASDIAAVLQYDAAHGNKARELMNGSTVSRALFVRSGQDFKLARRDRVTFYIRVERGTRSRQLLGCLGRRRGRYYRTS